MKFLNIPAHQLLVNKSLGESGKFVPLIHLVSENHTYTGEQNLDDVFLISIYPERLGFFHALCDVSTVDWSKVEFKNYTAQLDVISGVVGPMARICQYFDLANDQIKFVKSDIGVEDGLTIEHLKIFIEMMFSQSFMTMCKVSEDKKTLSVGFMEELDCSFHLEGGRLFFLKDEK